MTTSYSHLGCISLALSNFTTKFAYLDVINSKQRVNIISSN